MRIAGDCSRLGLTSVKEYELIKLPRLTISIDDFKGETMKRRYTDSVYRPAHRHRVWQGLIVQLLILFLLLVMTACSSGEDSAADATAMAAVTATPTATATANLPPTVRATHTPTLTPTLTSTPLPTDTPTPTATPSITPTPTPSPIAVYLNLVWEFVKGSNAIQNIIFKESEVSDETLVTYEALLETVTQIGEAVLDTEDLLPTLRPLIVEIVEVCSRANETWMAVARTSNESGKSVASSVLDTDEFLVPENFSAVDACENVLIPQFIQFIEAANGE